MRAAMVVAAARSVPTVGRMVDADELVGVAEIAARLGVAIQTVHAWRRRPTGFPEPVAHLSCGLVWSWPDVAAWVAERATGR